MFQLIARILETMATNRATRARNAHAMRRAQRMQREARQHAAREHRHPYPFHS